MQQPVDHHGAVGVDGAERAPESSAPVCADALSHLLRGCGIAPTPQRIAVAAVLLERPQHLSADQILARVRERQAPAAVGRAARGISKATVYNTLNLFARRGLVREVIVDPSRVFYDSNTDEHHHVFDMTSGRLWDVAPEQVRVLGLPDLPEGVTLEGIDVVVRVRSRPLRERR
ncbi:MAG: transcriptional repressor [Ectothiorhodospiraceae bacterium]|nr:transcriptional repressor [Chromatiales bacterium]MCP5155331.1 transcriptional repressor [Ectothiorhodospiraceae bacterium]